MTTTVDDRRRILVVISSLALGGAQRTVTLLTREWVAEGHDVEVVTFDAGDDFFGVSADVPVRPLDVMRASRSSVAALRSNALAIRLLRAEVRRAEPDVVVSFMDRTSVVCAMAAAGLGVPVVACERTNPAMVQLPPIWRWLRDRTYRSMALVVYQTTGAESWGRRVQKVRRSVVLPNPIVLPSAAKVDDRLVVALGRFAIEKRFDRVIHAFAEGVADASWKLQIGGAGPLVRELAALAAVVDPARISFPGIVDSEEFLARASIFVLSSDLEGFPNALVEAMAAGCAVISVDCHWGPGELIEDDVDGILVPLGDEGLLASALRRVTQDHELRSRLAAAARTSAQRFASPSVAQQWFDALESVMRQSRGRG